jgi:Ras-related protein Rab-2A
MVDA